MLQLCRWSWCTSPWSALSSTHKHTLHVTLPLHATLSVCVTPHDIFVDFPFMINVSQILGFTDFSHCL